MFIEKEQREVYVSPSREQQPLDDASKALLDAAALIERQGWIQRHARSPYGYCMFGAIWNIDATYTARRQAEHRLNAACGVGFIAIWNDAFGRTKDEVLAKMRAAALGG